MSELPPLPARARPVDPPLPARAKPVASFMDAGRSIIQNTAVETLAGIGGLGQAIGYASPESGGRYVEQFREQYGHQMSPAGQAAVEPVARFLQPVGDAIQSAGDSMGNAGAWAAEQLGGGTKTQAAGYALGKVLPDAALAVLGMGGVRAAGKSVSGPVSKDAIRIDPTLEPVGQLRDRTRIELGSSDEDLAGKRLVQGQVVKDPVGAEALKQGFEPGVIQAIKTSSPADKKAMGSMLEVFERGKRNKRYATLHRPADVLGSSIRKRVDLLRDVNKRAGRDVAQAADNLKGKTVDYSGAIDDFLDSLKKMDVYVTDEGRVVTKGSQIEGLSGLEAGINRIVKRMWDTKTPDAYDIHRLKKYIDENVGYGRLSEQGLSGKTEAALKQLRHNLNETLKQFPDYADANMRYSDTVEVLREMQQLAGMKTDITELSGDRAFGRVARKIFSNYQSRDQLISALDSLNTTASKYGGNFDDDILNQGLFVQEMERKFGSAASASFQGDIEKAIGRTMTEGIRATVTKGIADKTVEFYQRSRGINDDAAVKALRDLLQSQ